MSLPPDSAVAINPGLSRPPWTADALLRLRHHLPWKFAGISAFLAVFFNFYFSALESAQGAATRMPLMALDEWVRFEPLSIIPYLSLWFYVGLVPGLMLSWRDIGTYGIWAAFMCTIGLVCFALWPTEVPQRLPDDLQAWGFSLLQGVDAPANACPSLHVAGTVLTALWLNRLLHWIQTPWGLKLLNWVWAAAIIWSTMATRQHVALDVLGGLVLGLTIALPSLRLHPNLGRHPG